MAAQIKPDYWTIINHQNTLESSSTGSIDIPVQKSTAPIQTQGNVFYPDYEGGIIASLVGRVAEAIEPLPRAQFAGNTTCTAFLVSLDMKRDCPTAILIILVRAALTRPDTERKPVGNNTPITPSTGKMSKFASAGATRIEPGHGFTGSTLTHAAVGIPECSARLHFSEVSNPCNGYFYRLMGGRYIGSMFPVFRVQAFVGSTEDSAIRNLIQTQLPLPATNHNYGILNINKNVDVHVWVTLFALIICSGI